MPTGPISFHVNDDRLGSDYGVHVCHPSMPEDPEEYREVFNAVAGPKWHPAVAWYDFPPGGWLPKIFRRLP